MGRGTLTIKIEKLARAKLGFRITRTELRLMPYVQHVMMNEQRLEPVNINEEEREILAKWRKRGWIDGGAGGMTVSKEFWDAMSEILWLSYVDYE